VSGWREICSASGVRGDSGIFIKIHIPSDSFDAMFQPAFKLPGYKGPVTVTRMWDDDEGGKKPAQYCVLSPKYTNVLMAKEGDSLKQKPLKDVVEMAANASFDLVITAIFSCKVSKCTEAGVVKYTTNCILDKALLMGLAPKAETGDTASTPEFRIDSLSAVPECKALLSDLVPDITRDCAEESFTQVDASGFEK
jgi:hypothetical protein